MKPSPAPSAALALIALTFTAAAAATWPKFTDVTEAAGITFKHNVGDLEMSNIAEATGPGCAVLDYDNDGFMDVYFVNGRWHTDISDNRGRALKGKLKNALYHNNGNGTFTDVTDKAGVGGTEDGYGMAASAADYDNDGYLDL
jgi:enediyne biosynthesis protein E4